MNDVGTTAYGGRSIHTRYTSTRGVSLRIFTLGKIQNVCTYVRVDDF